jgi:hypothetical protein
MTSFGDIKVFDHDVFSIAYYAAGNSLTGCSTCCSSIAWGSVLSSKGNLDFALWHREHLLEIAAMRRRTAAWWNVHLD